MEYKKNRETNPRRVFGANVTPSMGEQPSMGERPLMGEQPSMGGQPSMWGQPSMGGQPSMWGQPSMGGQPSMWGQPSVMPGCQPQMMPRNPYSPNHRPPMMMPPYPVYPPNMAMPYYYGDTLRGMEVWNDNDFTEDDLDKELEQIMEMYPSRAREIQKKVVEVCDSIDYDGSILYDEYPDKFVLSKYCDKIYQDMDSTQVEMASENLETQQVSGTARQGGRGPCRNCRPDDGRRDLIDVLFFNEIFRRRCRKGKCRRW